MNTGTLIDYIPVLLIKNFLKIRQKEKILSGFPFFWDNQKLSSPLDLGYPYHKTRVGALGHTKW